MKFVVIENKPYYRALVKQAICKAGFSADDIWSAKDETVSDWRAAFEVLASLTNTPFDPKNDVCVLVVDLALDDDDTQFSEGVAQLRAQSAGILEAFVRIACTLFPTRAPRDVLDGVIDKREIEATSDWTSFRTELNAAIDSWQRRTGRRHSESTGRAWRWEDSMAARRADAAFGASVLSAVVNREAGGWVQVVVTALTGGYSGSYVLMIDGNEPGVGKSVVIKMTRDRAALLRETASWRRALEAYHAFVGVVPPQSEPVHLTSSGDVWYVVQSSVPGVTLERRLNIVRRKGEMPALRRDLQDTFERITQLSEQSVKASFVARHAPVHLRFTDDDCDRFADSCVYLQRLDVQWRLRRRARTSIRTDDLIRVVRRWTEAREMADLLNVPCYEQHGDLNPRNVMLTASGLQLIDYARVDLWPVGYDMLRLELQTSVRVLDVDDAKDAFPEQLGLWSRLLDSWGCLRPAEGVNRATYPVYVGFLRHTAKWRERLLKLLGEREDKSRVLRTMALGRCYDAVRMCSYQDISPFKRLWCLQIAELTATASGLLTPRKP